MNALDEMKAALQEAKTEAATLRIRVRELEAKLVEMANACDPVVVVDRATHTFLPTPFYVERCDVRVDEDGRIRICGRPQSEHVTEPVGGPEQDRGAAALRPAEPQTSVGRRVPIAGMYPPGWPHCACGDYVLDGKATCGRVECHP